MQRGKRVRFSWDTAVATADAFARVTGIPCRLYGENGVLLHEQQEGPDRCAFCLGLTAMTGQAPHCEGIHAHGALESRRFGGRYIYLCPQGLAYFSSPIITEGSLSGALVCGPVLIMDPEDLLDPSVTDALSADQWQRLLELLSSVPRMEPARLSDLSGQLFANALVISDETHSFFAIQRDNRQQNAIGDYISQLKRVPGGPAYPLETERDLCREVAQGRTEAAQALLEELLGWLWSNSVGEEEILQRCWELAVVLERAALRGGVPEQTAFALCRQAVRELRQPAGQEARTRILSGMLRSLTLAADRQGEGEHRRAIDRAVNYMKVGLAGKITLQETAAYAGYSPSYFSRVFREEMGCSFQTYLNRLRVERSKTLLLEGQASIAEICGMVGFSDQSYFCKVFRSVTQVTPIQYRTYARQIDGAKERDKA